MNHRLVFILVGFLLLSLSVLQPTQAQYTASDGVIFPHTADGRVFVYVSPIYIDSPINTTYMINQVYLNFTVKNFVMAGAVNTTMSYSLDGKDNVTIPLSVEFVPLWADVGYTNGTQTKEVSQFYSYYLISGSVELKDLQLGPHSLTIFARYELPPPVQEIGFTNQTVYFTIDTENSLVISGLSAGVDASRSESSVIIICTSVCVFLFVATVVYALFIKHKVNDKNTTSLNVTV